MTQDVNHILAAMNVLCQNVSTDLKEIDFDETLTDYKLSKAIKFQTVSLMKDLMQLKNLYPENFKIKEPPSELNITLKYSGKTYGGGPSQLRHGQFQYIKATGKFNYGYWDRTWFAIQYEDRYKEQNTRFSIDRNRDFIEVLETDKIWVVTTYPSGRERDPKCRFFRYELAVSVAEYTPSKLLIQSFDFIAKKRSTADKSCLFVNYDSENENIRYHLLTYENDTFTARTYKFCIKDDQLESDCISEKTLVPTLDIEIAKYELRDFKVSEELNQY